MDSAGSLTKSAQALGPNQGDVQTHIFYINTDPVDRSAMFTEDGGQVLLDDDGKASVTLDFVCQRCHETATLEELAKFAKDFHEDDKTLEDVGLTAGLTGTWWNAARSGEGFLLQLAYPLCTQSQLCAQLLQPANLSRCQAIPPLDDPPQTR